MVLLLVGLCCTETNSSKGSTTHTYSSAGNPVTCTPMKMLYERYAFPHHSELVEKKVKRSDLFSVSSMSLSNALKFLYFTESWVFKTEGVNV